MSDSFLSSGALNSLHQNVNAFSPQDSNSMTTSRPFLNMLNPLGRNYRGYERAHEDVVEEEDEENGSDNGGNDDPGEGIGGGTRGWLQANAAPNASDANRIRMGNLRAQTPDNVVRDPDEDDEDDGEVPQSFMIEAHRGSTSAKPRPPSGDIKASHLASPNRLLSRGVLKRAAKATFSDMKGFNMPPRPSDLQSPGDFALPAPNTTSSSSATGRKTGLDAYERALWNWVNVYNLDAFLQEVGIFCIILVPLNKHVGAGVCVLPWQRDILHSSVSWAEPAVSFLLSMFLHCGVSLTQIHALRTVGFVIGFSTFLLGCVDYSKIPTSHLLHELIVPHCVSR